MEMVCGNDEGSKERAEIEADAEKVEDTRPEATVMKRPHTHTDKSRMGPAHGNPYTIQIVVPPLRGGQGNCRAS